MKNFNLIILTCCFFIYFTSVAQVSIIPFKTIDNSHITIKIKVNEIDEELDFVFDTGASTGVIDSSTANRLGLKADRKTRVPGAGGIQTYDLIMNKMIQIGNKIQLNLPYLVSADMTRFHEISDEHYQGIIGYNLLSQFVTKMDYQNERIELYNSVKEIDLDGYEKTPFTFHSGSIPVIEVSFTLNGKTYSGKVLFDSGAAQSLSINTPFVNENKLRSKANKKVVRKSENLGTTSTSERISIQSFQLGSFQLKDLTISLSGDKKGVSSYKEYLGILGAKIIQRFHIVLDYKKQNLYLKPNNKFKEAFEFPMSTLRLRKKNGKILIDDLDKNGDEYAAGVRKGDIVLSMNDQSSKFIEFYKNMLKKEGEMRLKVKTKNGQIKTCTFRLRNLLK